MALELIQQLEAVARPTIQLNAGVSCDSQCLPVCRKRVVGNRVVEEMIHLWRGHFGVRIVIGGALYYRYDVRG